MCWIAKCSPKRSAAIQFCTIYMITYSTFAQYFDDWFYYISVLTLLFDRRSLFCNGCQVVGDHHRQLDPDLGWITVILFIYFSDTITLLCLDHVWRRVMWELTWLRTRSAWSRWYVSSSPASSLPVCTRVKLPRLPVNRSPVIISWYSVSYYPNHCNSFHSSCPFLKYACFHVKWAKCRKRFVLIRLLLSIELRNMRL